MNEYYLRRLHEANSKCQNALNQSFDLKYYRDTLENIKPKFHGVLAQDKELSRRLEFVYGSTDLETFERFQYLLQTLNWFGRFDVANGNIPDSLGVDAKDLNMIYRLADILSVMMSKLINYAENTIHLATHIEARYHAQGGLKEAKHDDSLSPFQKFIIDKTEHWGPRERQMQEDFFTLPPCELK